MANGDAAKRQYNRKKAKTIKDLSLNQMGKDLKQPALVVLGAAVSTWGTKQLNKALDSESAVSGLLGIDKKKLKKYIVPGASLLTGLAIHQLAPHEYAKLVGLGIAANGTIHITNEILGKDLLSGLGEASPEKSLPQHETRQIEHYAKRPSEPLDLPLYEIEEPNAYTSRYIDSVMSEIQQPETRREVVPPEPVKEEKEVILSSDRPEDNYEAPKLERENAEPEISGTLESIVLPPEIMHPERNYEREYEEELDFSDIP